MLMRLVDWCVNELKWFVLFCHLHSPYSRCLGMPKYLMRWSSQTDDWPIVCFSSSSSFPLVVSCHCWHNRSHVLLPIIPGACSTSNVGACCISLWWNMGISCLSHGLRPFGSVDHWLVWFSFPFCDELICPRPQCPPSFGSIMES
jgi:hypothetical protein